MFKKHSRVYEREGGAGFATTARRSSPRVRRAGARTYTVCIYRNEGRARGYWVDFPGVPGIVAGGDTIAQSLRRAREALAVHLAWLLEDGETLPGDRLPKPGAKPRPAVTQRIKVSLARP
jgi:predicted RNase H-like HicB family nuclease